MRKSFARVVLVSLLLAVMTTAIANAEPRQDTQAPETTGANRPPSGSSPATNEKTSGLIRIELPGKSVVTQSPGQTVEAERSMSNTPPAAEPRAASGTANLVTVPLTFSLHCTINGKAPATPPDEVFPERIEIRNVGVRLVPSGTRITWPVKDSEKVGAFSLKKGLAPGQTMTLKQLRQPIRTGISCAVLVR